MKTISRVLPGVILLAATYVATVNAAGDVTVPFSLAKGQSLFNENCSSCHGKQLDGSAEGPPLLHPYYKPSHHGDQAFYRAALNGARQHHWNFGDMKAVPGMTEDKMKSILPYIRYYQQQKGLY